MKIGFSFGRCVASIVRGEVDINDVMCIIGRTNMPLLEHVEYVINEYLRHPGYLMGLDPARCLEVGQELWNTGKLVEPRGSNIGVRQVPRDYVWMDLFPTVTDVTNEGVQASWEAYRMMIGLTSEIPDIDAAEIAHSEKFTRSRAQAEAARLEARTPEQIAADEAAEAQKKAQTDSLLRAMMV